MKRSPIRRSPGRRTDPAVVELVKARAGGVCEMPGCDRLGRDPHHRQLKAHGGPDSLDNLLWVCSACHRAIHDDPAHSYENGSLVHSWDDPVSKTFFGSL